MLCKGPKFCPSTKGNYIHTKGDTKSPTRKLKLREHFWDCDYDDESIVKHSSVFNPKCEDLELNRILNVIESLDPDDN